MGAVERFGVVEVETHPAAKTYRAEC